MAHKNRKGNPENRPNIVLTLKKNRKNGITHDETITGLSSIQAAEAIARQHGLYDDIYIIKNGKTGKKICAGRVGRTMNKGKNAGLRYLESEEQMNERAFQAIAAESAKVPANKDIYEAYLKSVGTSPDMVPYSTWLRTFKNSK